MTDREKARDLGNKSAELARSIADVLNDTLDALARCEARAEAAEALAERRAEALRALLDIVASADRTRLSIIQGVHVEAEIERARAALADEGQENPAP